MLVNVTDGCDTDHWLQDVAKASDSMSTLLFSMPLLERMARDVLTGCGTACVNGVSVARHSVITRRL